MRNFLRKFEFVGNAFLLLLIIGIFGTSLFTVVNLTPGYDGQKDEPEILGVTTSNNGKGLVLKNISKQEIPLSSLEIISNGNDQYRIKVTLDKHNRGQYYLPLVNVLNKNSKDKKVDVSMLNSDINNTNTTTYILINNEKYSVEPEDAALIPYFNLGTGKSFDLGLYLNSESDVNFKTEVEILVKVIK